MDRERPVSRPTLPLDRRSFLARLGFGAAFVSLAGFVTASMRFVVPSVLYESPSRVPLGPPEHFPPGEVTYLADQRLFVFHDADGISALSAVCTHLGCLTAWQPELGIIACPCHGSKFKRDGSKIEGPAPRPLPWLRMWLSDEGDLMVDRAVLLSSRQLVKV